MHTFWWVWAWVAWVDDWMQLKGTWAFLGWGVSVGLVSTSVQGSADDGKGDMINKRNHPNHTLSVSACKAPTWYWTHPREMLLPLVWAACWADWQSKRLCCISYSWSTQSSVLYSPRATSFCSKTSEPSPTRYFPCHWSLRKLRLLVSTSLETTFISPSLLGYALRNKRSRISSSPSYPGVGPATLKIFPTET